MKSIKLFIVFIAVLCITGLAWAGNSPEYDAVGTDADNFFAETVVYYQVVNASPNPSAMGLQQDSNFYNESFWTNAGQLKESPCYGIEAALTDVWNEGTYRWRIVLQMKPESDINLNIYDCVLKHNETDLYMNADQTGRFRLPFGALVFNPLWNPRVTAMAYPGPYATSGFNSPITLDTRTIPGLFQIPLDGLLYTSKAHFPEGIVMALPVSGFWNRSGQLMYNLKQGDIIQVTVSILPNSNTVDVWYGPDSVLLKYIGVVNTEAFASQY